MRYTNMDDVVVTGDLKGLLGWLKERRSKQKDLSYQLPRIENPATDWLRANRELPTITYIGHSTLLIQLAGLNIITDPVWAKWLGMYRRLTQPGLKIEELPDIDVVLLSHSHYDHLHYGSIKRLPGNPQYLVPAGLKRAFNRKGFKRVSEFQWWESLEIGPLTFTFVPAQHWTKRSLLDTDRSHWGGWMMESETAPTVYFAGDSGYFRGFQEIGDAFEIDICLMPIGAYEPEWFMKGQHVNPEEAVQAFLDTRAKEMIPIHFGAYMLADDTPLEALERTQAEWERQGIDPNRLRVMRLGELYKLT